MRYLVRKLLFLDRIKAVMVGTRNSVGVGADRAIPLGFMEKASKLIDLPQRQARVIVGRVGRILS
jgi:hypothetical protein